MGLCNPSIFECLKQFLISLSLPFTIGISVLFIWLMTLIALFRDVDKSCYPYVIETPINEFFIIAYIIAIASPFPGSIIIIK